MGSGPREEAGGDCSDSISSSRARADPRWNRRGPIRRGPSGEVVAVGEGRTIGDSKVQVGIKIFCLTSR
ncbi:hypothetical protein ZWY2020_032498 [Hordeum vulgare]|nr:hypothetical protein ZWY2020_032498 [Hordeum vulgare]